MRYRIIILTVLLLGACAGTPGTDTENKTAQFPPPQWIKYPPTEEGFVFGIGVDQDITAARYKSVISAGQQFSAHVKCVFEEKSQNYDNESKMVISKIEEQVTNQTINGIKFYDQYEDERGNVWVLSKAPVNCLLDITEALIISYQLELKQNLLNLDQVMDEFIQPSESQKEWIMTLGKRVPWTPRVRRGAIKVDGSISDWENIPPYYVDQEEDERFKGTDLSLIKCAMDDKNVYFLLLNNRDSWEDSMTFEMDFDYTPGTLYQPGLREEIDLHTKIIDRKVKFWDQGESSGYNPGIKMKKEGGVFEFSLPTKRYETGYFNIVTINTWFEESLSDRTYIDYLSTWIDEDEAKRRLILDYSVLTQE